MSVDPLAEKYPSWNPYAYTFNNPINFIDPTGMAPEDLRFRGPGAKKAINTINRGLGVQVGLVNDAVGNTDFFINFNGNIGFGGGAGWDAGTVAPTGNNQFLNSDFAGNSAGYNAGVSTPVFDASWTKGGTIDPNLHAIDKMKPSNFGDTQRGYRTSQAGFGSGGSWRAGGMWSYGTTKVF